MVVSCEMVDKQNQQRRGRADGTVTAVADRSAMAKDRALTPQTAPAMLAWALAAALVAVTKGRGRWLILVLAGDAFWALNFGGSLLVGEGAEKSKVQLGETATFTGAWALLILLFFYVLPFVLGAIWCARHVRDCGQEALAAD